MFCEDKYSIVNNYFEDFPNLQCILALDLLIY
jgi:hypothetical protein